MSTEIEALEERLLELESLFSQKEDLGQAKHIKEFIEIAGSLTRLKEEEAKKQGFELGLEEGLLEGVKAGLLVQQLKEQRLTKEKPKETTAFTPPEETQIPEKPQESPTPPVESNLPQIDPNQKVSLVKETVDSNPEQTPFIHHDIPEPSPQTHSPNTADRNPVPAFQPLEARNPRNTAPPSTGFSPQGLGSDTNPELIPWRYSFLPPKKPLDRAISAMDFVEENTSIFPNLSEANLGKYVMGILAALLTLLGVVLLGALVWQSIPNTVKALLQFALATPMIVIPYRKISQEPDKMKNGFYTSLVGAGLSICYITSVFMGTSWKIIGSTLLLLFLLALIYLTVFLAHRILSNTLLVVSFMGTLFTLLLLGMDSLATQDLYISLFAMLTTTCFLMVYTLKSQWTTMITKFLATFLGYFAMHFSLALLDEYTYQIGSLFGRYHYYDTASQLFPLFLFVSLYTLFLGALLGWFVGDLSSYSEKSLSPDKAITGHQVLQGILLFAIFFFSVFTLFQVPLLMLLFILSTFLWNQERAVECFVSVPFIVVFTAAALASLSLNQWELLWYWSLLALASFTYFLGRRRDSVFYHLSCTLYTSVALVVALVVLEEVLLPLVPLLVIYTLFFYQSYLDKLDGLHESFNFLKLISFLPVSLLLAKIFWFLQPSKSLDFTVFFPIILFLIVNIILFAEDYWGRDSEWSFFSRFLFSIQSLAFVNVFYVMLEYDRYPHILFLAMLVLLFGVVHTVLKLFIEQENYTNEKANYLVFLLFLLNGMAHITILGEFPVTSSTLMIFVGAFSIFFYRSDDVLRRIGLIMSVLGVLKLVILDVASTDSIIRIFALIFGALLCFGISCFYNKMDE